MLCAAAAACLMQQSRARPAVLCLHRALVLRPSAVCLLGMCYIVLWLPGWTSSSKWLCVFVLLLHSLSHGYSPLQYTHCQTLAESLWQCQPMELCCVQSQRTGYWCLDAARPYTLNTLWGAPAVCHSCEQCSDHCCRTVRLLCTGLHCTSLLFLLLLISYSIAVQQCC